MAERRKVRFRISDDPKRPRRFQIESDVTGSFAPVIVGLDGKDVDGQVERLRHHGCEVQDCRTRQTTPIVHTENR